MPALVLNQTEQQINIEPLQARLQKETAEFQSAYKARILRFMAENGIESVADIDYPARVRFEQWLKGKTTPAGYQLYMVAFDNMKRYSLDREMRIIQNGKAARPKYENTILFLPYHPNPAIRKMFKKSPDKNRLAWDFTRKTSERLKRQVFDILHYALESDSSYESRRVRL